jgi:hypothetical protein
MHACVHDPMLCDVMPTAGECVQGWQWWAARTRACPTSLKVPSTPLALPMKEGWLGCSPSLTRSGGWHVPLSGAPMLLCTAQRSSSILFSLACTSAASVNKPEAGKAAAIINVAGATAMLHTPLHACNHVCIYRGIGCNASASIPPRLHFFVCMLRMHLLSHER